VVGWQVAGSRWQVVGSRWQVADSRAAQDPGPYLLLTPYQSLVAAQVNHDCRQCSVDGGSTQGRGGGHLDHTVGTVTTVPTVPTATNVTSVTTVATVPTVTTVTTLPAVSVCVDTLEGLRDVVTLEGGD
jgi:hypothetical protein